VCEQTPVAAVACTLGRDDLASQADRWARLWGEAGLERIETDAGVRLVYLDGPAVEKELRALVAVENECCKWASWGVGRTAGRLVMEVTSTDAEIEALHAMFATAS
jgi:hypothetical protein